MRFPSFWPFFIAAALLAGCAVFHPKPVSPSRTAAEFEARTLGDPGLQAFVETSLRREISPWPPRAWDFSLLTLAAFYYHPDLDVARARWGVARAGVITAGGRPNPNLGVTPQYASDTAGGLLPQWTVGFNLDLPIETAGKRRYRIAQAERLSEAARLNIASAAWRVRSRLRSRLLELYRVERTGTLLGDEETIQEEAAVLLEERLKAGEVSQPEVTQARLASDRTRFALRDLERQRAEAEAASADALGLPATALEGIVFSFDFFEGAPAVDNALELRRAAMTNRADLLSALSEYAASQSALQVEIARQYPDVHLGPGYIWEPGGSTWSLALSLALPLLNHNEGPIAEAEARRSEAAARFTALQASVIGETDRALLGYRAARQSLKEADALLSVQKKLQTSMEAMFNAGEADRLALLGGRLELNAAERARFDAQLSAARALALLEEAVQRPLDPSEPPATPSETNPRSDPDRHFHAPSKGEGNR